jgi:hypothetical protein
MTKDKKVLPHPENTLETRVALLEQSIININETMKEIKSELKEIRHEANSNFKWLLGTIFGFGTFFTGALIGLGTIMAHGFHWF